MNTIIYEIIEKITEDIKNNVGNLIENSRDISTLVKDTSKSLDEIGAMIIKGALELNDDIIRNSKDRKKKYYIQRRNDPKTLITEFGEVNYKRTYYKDKKDGSYIYLSDQMLGINPFDRMDLSYEAVLIDKSTQGSYEKSGKEASDNIQVTRQTVMNTIRKLGKVENTDAKIKKRKRTIETLYIEADEDHVAMQDGTNKEIKLVYVHEGKSLISKDRYKLKNSRYFTGEYKNTEELWLEVADYLDKAYYLDKVKKIYLSGDGAHWIKEGLNWINKSEYVLDYFHLSKYVRVATAHMEPYFHTIIWGYINELNKEAVTEILNIIIDHTESKTKKEAVKVSKRYILRNWEGIARRYDEEYIGCSAEGHVSHILSDRLSSRPLGWCLTGADQMARLRVFKTNGGDIYEIMMDRKKEKEREDNIIKIEEKILRRRLTVTIPETIDNLPYINDGRRTWQRQILKGLRGA